MSEQLMSDVKKIVETIWSQKEEAAKKEHTEKALNESAAIIERLTKELELKNTEISSAADQTEIFNTEISGLQTKITTLTTEKETVQKELDSTKATILGMEKDKAADLRIKELQDAVVLASDVAKQREKVREMTDAEFATYKAERVELKNQVKKELEAAATATAAASTTTTTTTVVTDPVEVASADKVAAGLNLENASGGKDILSKYAELGKAMALSMKKDKSSTK